MIDSNDSVIEICQVSLPTLFSLLCVGDIAAESVLMPINHTACRLYYHRMWITKFPL